MNEPRVFITNYAGHTYDGARQYGNLVALTKGYVSFGSLDRMKYNVFERILKDTEREDWLLLSGVPIISAIAAMLWFTYHGKCKMLIWDRKKPDGPYRELIIDRDNYEMMLNEIERDAA